MGLISKVASRVVSTGASAVERGAAAAKKAAEAAGKAVKGTPKPAQKVNIISDEFTKTPGVLNLTTGTKTFKDIGGGIRLVQPGENTKFGKLGVEEVITYPKGYFATPFGDNTKPLLVLKFKGAEKAMPPQTPEEVKATLEYMREMQKLAKENPVNKAFMKVMNYFAPKETL